MADDDYDHVPLDLSSPEAQAALTRAFALGAAARGAAMARTAQAWTDYELEINRVVTETLTDPLELTVDRLAWALHGLATVAGASVYYASLANQEDPHEIELAVQRVIEAFEPGSAPSSD
jgi:hypothetical protein